MELVSFNPFPRYAIHVGVGDDPLSWATLAALYSRSRDSAAEALDKAKSAKKRMIEQYYVGYGHDSIGDLVDVRLFLEGVPMWFAFLIEHHSRFRGQESSTRYIDFSTSEATEPGMEKWYKDHMYHYENTLEKVKNGIANETSQWSTANENPKVVEAAINARAFDICRGTIPIQAPTNVAWFGSIQQMRGHLSWILSLSLTGRDVPKVERWVNPIIDALNEVYPETKPVKVVRPHVPYDQVDGPTVVSLESSLDFGSLRDLHRHRPGWHSTPDVWSSDDFHPWYTEKLAQYGIDFEAEGYHDYQYMLLGHQLDFTYAASLHRWQYIFALRTKPTVHPTLRSLLQTSYHNLREDMKPFIEVDMSQDISHGYYLHRGTQTIEVK